MTRRLVRLFRWIISEPARTSDTDTDTATNPEASLQCLGCFYHDPRRLKNSA